jgi:hypothetical protein
MNVAADSDDDCKPLRFAVILSHAAESVVHVAAVFFAAYNLRLSYKPADDEHEYGHAKMRPEQPVELVTLPVNR